MAILKTEGLTKAFGSVYAVKDADTVIEKGGIYGLLGSNGSGKTTYMKIIAGLLNPTCGKAEVAGIPVGTQTKKSVAFMCTEQFFYRYMTIRQVGRFYLDFYEDFDWARYAQLVKYMELDMEMKVKSLSSGMAAKLRVAVTMSRNALLFMLDEPLNGIDLIARDKIVDAIIRQAGENNAIILSSHLIDAVENLLDSVMLIKKGKIVLSKNAEELRAETGKSIAQTYREVFTSA